MAPIGGKYFEKHSPLDGELIAKVSQSDHQDVDKAIDDAWAAASTWTKTSATERSNMLLKIADRMEANLDKLALVESFDNGKALRETTLADLPLAIDHFRYFAGVIRGESGEICDLDANTVSQEVHEPLGVVAQIIPWNFPILMATWKLAPALAAGNCVVLNLLSKRLFPYMFCLNSSLILFLRVLLILLMVSVPRLANHLPVVIE